MSGHNINSNSLTRYLKSYIAKVRAAVSVPAPDYSLKQSILPFPLTMPEMLLSVNLGFIYNPVSPLTSQYVCLSSTTVKVQFLSASYTKFGTCSPSIFQPHRLTHVTQLALPQF